METIATDTLEEQPMNQQVYFGRGEQQITLIWNGIDEKPTMSDWVEMMETKPLSGRHYADSNGTWKPLSQENFESEMVRVDDARRNAYFQIVTPLLDEARIKREMIKTPEAIAEADVLEQQALAARFKIQEDNPWPIPPITE
ncbi:hypothetical protein ACEC37_001486 [Vibrio fluvialis]